MEINIQNLLGLSALILSIVNGLFLIRNHLRDKPKLVVEPVHPDVYQWWFKLPEGEHEGQTTRKYGFLCYISIKNKGLRKVSLTSWRLFIKTKGIGSRIELKPLSIPEPSGNIGESENVKVYSVLGQQGVVYGGDTLVKSGTSISGTAYYVAEFYGDDVWDVRIKNNKIKGKIVVTDVFGKKATNNIEFQYKEFEFITDIIEDIEKIR